jgi:hypothetical protein
MTAPLITQDIVFQSISSPEGNSPFDKALANRDKQLVSYVQKINPNALATSWGDEVLSDIAEIFPGLGDFGPGGGPLA